MEEITQIAPTYFGFNESEESKVQIFRLYTDGGYYIARVTLRPYYGGCIMSAGGISHISEGAGRQVSQSEKSWVIDYIKENLEIV